jgi:sigma-E factor negative regulatory protein RseC
MVEEQGVVIQVRNGFVEVEAQRGSACGGCGEKGACATGALGRLFSRRHRLWIRNSIGAAPGDAVVMGMRDDDVLGLSASAYMVPVVGLILGAGAGETLVRTLAMASELPVILGAAAGLALGLSLVRRVAAADSDPAERIVLLRKEPKSAALVRIT